MTPYDAQAITYYMSDPSENQNLLPLTDLSNFQRQQMDPNHDYLFNDVSCIVPEYSTPCPNGASDVTYLLRYVVF